MIAFATAALLGVSTPLAVYAKQAFAEPLLACLAAGAWLALARGLKTRSKVSLAIASALAGWAFATRFVPGSMLAFALAAGFAFERRRWPGWREVLAMALPFVVLASSCLALNLARFGDPLQFGYPDAAEGGKALNAFSTPILHGLWGLLLSPGKGIFLFAPIVIAALLWRGNAVIENLYLNHLPVVTYLAVMQTNMAKSNLDHARGKKKK